MRVHITWGTDAPVVPPAVAWRVMSTIAPEPRVDPDPYWWRECPHCGSKSVGLACPACGQDPPEAKVDEKPRRYLDLSGPRHQRMQRLAQAEAKLDDRRREHPEMEG